MLCPIIFLVYYKLKKYILKSSLKIEDDIFLKINKFI